MLERRSKSSLLSLVCVTEHAEHYHACHYLCLHCRSYFFNSRETFSAKMARVDSIQNMRNATEMQLFKCMLLKYILLFCHVILS